MKKLNGNGKQKCTKCSHQSISGLVKGNGLCPYHWSEMNWGTAWAQHCYPNFPGQVIGTIKKEDSVPN